MTEGLFTVRGFNAGIWYTKNRDTGQIGTVFNTSVLAVWHTVLCGIGGKASRRSLTLCY